MNACAAAGIEPVIAMGREAHHPTLAERFAEDPALPQDPSPVASMCHRLQTKAGKARYALRKQTPEPVFGIIKSVLGFRQFLLRGLNKVRGEWSLVTMAWNMKRMFALCPSLGCGCLPIWWGIVGQLGQTADSIVNAPSIFFSGDWLPKE